MDLVRNPGFILWRRGATEVFSTKTVLYHVFTINWEKLGRIYRKINTRSEADEVQYHPKTLHSKVLAVGMQRNQPHLNLEKERGSQSTTRFQREGGEEEDVLEE